MSKQKFCVACENRRPAPGSTWCSRCAHQEAQALDRAALVALEALPPSTRAVVAGVLRHVKATRADDAERAHLCRAVAAVFVRASTLWEVKATPGARAAEEALADADEAAEVDAA